MGNVLIMLGLFFIYVSETLWVIMEAQKEREQMSIFEYIICCVPALRVIYLLVE